MGGCSCANGKLLSGSQVPLARKVWSFCVHPQRRKLRKQRAVSGDRFVQMCVDLSTLRWSWNDYILIHEIISEPRSAGLDAEGDNIAQTIQARSATKGGAIAGAMDAMAHGVGTIAAGGVAGRRSDSGDVAEGAESLPKWALVLE